PFYSVTDGKLLLAPEERHFAMVFQDLALWPHMPCRSTWNSRHPTARGSTLCYGGSLDGKAQRRPAHLSGGERQRVALARALVGEPRGLYSTSRSNVDDALRAELIALLRELLAERRRAFLFVTHDLREAGALANRVAVIEQGPLVQIGTMADLQARPATKFVEALLAD